MLRNTCVLFSAIFLSVHFSHAQDDLKSLADFALESDDVFFDHVVVQTEASRILKKPLKNGEVSNSDLKPRKVGLVTVYIFEEKFTSAKGRLIYSYEKDGDPNYLFKRIAGPMVQNFEDAFSEGEIDLITPIEYLSDAQSKEKYQALGKKLSVSAPFTGAVKGEGDPSGGEYQFIYK